MYAKFPLFHSPIDLAHTYWKSIIKPGDIVIDATCGNGHDTLVLAELSLTSDSGSLYALDVQPEAIESCSELLASKLSKEVLKQIRLIQCCHSQFPSEIAPHSAALIAYNLGYLPGGDKSKTTVTGTTLQSIEEAKKLIKNGGVISITCYPGHQEGKEEESRILDFTASLDPREWSCCHHRWMNRRNSPSLCLIQRRL